MFTMLLRKLLQGARLDDVTQPGLERVLELHFTGTNELGDRVTYRLVIEILSRYANILLLDGNGKIIDCIRRMTGETGNRRLLPGVDYTLPPPQDKLNILTEDLDTITPSVANLRCHRRQGSAKYPFGCVAYYLPGSWSRG